MLYILCNYSRKLIKLTHTVYQDTGDDFTFNFLQLFINVNEKGSIFTPIKNDTPPLPKMADELLDTSLLKRMLNSIISTAFCKYLTFQNI